MKICRCCHAEKTLDDFPKRTRSLDGRYSWCRACISIKNSRANEARRAAGYRFDPLEIVRTCRSCHVEKPIESFKRSLVGPKCRKSMCAACEQVYRKEHPISTEDHSRYVSTAREKRKNPSYRIYLNAKKTSWKHNLKFALSLEDITIPKVCPILGTEIRPDDASVANKPTITLIDRDLGFVRDNIRIVSFRGQQSERMTRKVAETGKAVG